jgi:hypothetical protein
MSDAMTDQMTEAHPARPLVGRLTEVGYSPEQISTFMHGRVSARTIYRWGSGGSDPQNPSDLDELKRLADALAPIEAHEPAPLPSVELPF